MTYFRATSGWRSDKADGKRFRRSTRLLTRAALNALRDWHLSGAGVDIDDKP
jgi:hypothetical protein